MGEEKEVDMTVFKHVVDFFFHLRTYACGFTSTIINNIE